MHGIEWGYMWLYLVDIFCQGPAKTSPYHCPQKKKQIICVALQAFATFSEFLCRPLPPLWWWWRCRRSKVTRPPSLCLHTHTGALCCVLVMVMKIVCPPEQAVCWLLHLSCQFSWRTVKAKQKYFLVRWNKWKLITPGSLIENWGKQLERNPLHLQFRQTPTQFRQAPTSNIAINLTDFLRSLYVSISVDW